MTRAEQLLRMVEKDAETTVDHGKTFDMMDRSKADSDARKRLAGSVVQQAYVKKHVDRQNREMNAPWRERAAKMAARR